MVVFGATGLLFSSNAVRDEEIPLLNNMPGQAMLGCSLVSLHFRFFLALYKRDMLPIHSYTVQTAMYLCYLC